MSTGKPIPDHVRTAAVDDYRNSGDSMTVVAKRHGVSKSTLSTWVNPPKPRPKREESEELAYAGVHEFDPNLWESRGGVLYPLFPERRSA